MKIRQTLLLAGLAWALAASPALAGTILYLLPCKTASKQPLVETLRLREGVERAEPALRAPLLHPDLRLSRWLRLEVDPAEETSLLAARDRDPEVERVEAAPLRTVDGFSELDGLPNDPLAPYQWQLEQVSAYAAWDRVGDASGVTIAVIDNGFDMTHADLKTVLWNNTAEKNGHAGADDDGNGFVDDVHGWNFYDNNGDPSAPVDEVPPPQNIDHGTHCAGIALAAHNNGVGGSGVAPGARLMALRAGRGTQITDGVEALIYAADNGADIISMSYSGPAESVFERDAVAYALAQGSVLVAASGNDDVTSPNYPAAYEGVIGVAATDEQDAITSFSNTGSWVDIAAPGIHILSTIVGGYGYESGTSMATPLVAGIAALVRAADPNASVETVRTRLLQGARPVTTETPTASPRGRADAWRTSLAERPVVLFDSMTVVDENGDGILEQGETASLVLHLELVGPAASHVGVQLQSLDSGLQADGLQGWSDLSAGAFDSDPFSLVVGNDANRGLLPFGLQMNADGWQETRTLDIMIDPHWHTHDAGGMIATVTDFGALGYRDYVANRDRARGVRLIGDPVGMLFHGSLMITDGVSVSDCAYGNNNQNSYDFFTADNGDLRQAASPADRETWTARYTDGMQPGTVGTLVDQTSTSFPDGSNILFLSYQVTPLQPGESDLTVGVFCDWDIRPSTTNIVRYNSTNHLSYMIGEGGAAGVMVVGNTAVTSAVAIDNQAVIYQSFTDAEKRDLLLSGMNHTEILTPGDNSQLIAVTLPNLSPTTSGRAQFAMLAASSETELLQIAGQVNTIALRGMGVETPLPAVFTLAPAWPNPFNSSALLQVTLPEAGMLGVRIFDLLGRKVAVLADGERAAGRYLLEWNGKNEAGAPVASGTYLVRAETRNAVSTRKLTLVR